MRPVNRFILTALCLFIFLFKEMPVSSVCAVEPRDTSLQQQDKTYKLSDLPCRDPDIFPDPGTKTYYLVGSSGKGVKIYSSKDLENWQGPRMIYTIPHDLWGTIPVDGIWAPELHFYNGKYYLFLTFSTSQKFFEQWRNWYPRVMRGSQILVSDSITGPFTAFQSHSTLPVDMITLDGTLWVEDSTPYMVFCNEWVQITNGTINYIQLKGDLSETAGEPKILFRATQAPWSMLSTQYGCNVTDGPYLYKGKTGKLFMIWSSFGYPNYKYTTGIAISVSGKLAGPWVQQAEPVFKDDGGHGMLFTAFDGKLMMVLHTPNDRNSRSCIFEMEDTGETLKIVKKFIGF